ncbi:hypothetical protein JIR23_22080 [Bradyrhizobium diazoefficiens]|nr:hypothetical protein [Bradyrhizobium diazoefficiens]QQN62271.1 hypothetical protein JIR23_22080 [Bradyrhizobium diazoefficiens]
MSYLSVLAIAAVLSALTATPAAFATEKHHARKAPQSVSEQIRYTGTAVIALPERPSNYLPGAPSIYAGGWSAPAGH